jgi:hypothetical protein
VDIVVPFFTPQREPTPEEPPAITFREPTPAVSSDTPSRSATPESTQELEAKGKAPERAPGLTIAEIMAGTQTITAGMVQLQQQQQQQLPPSKGEEEAHLPAEEDQREVSLQEDHQLEDPLLEEAAHLEEVAHLEEDHQPHQRQQQRPPPTEWKPRGQGPNHI